jgi:proteic killer suppression protein
VDAKHPYRLILVCNHEETPRKPDGGLDWTRITEVQLIEIADTH